MDNRAETNLLVRSGLALRPVLARGTGQPDKYSLSPEPGPGRSNYEDTITIKVWIPGVTGAVPIHTSALPVC